jgi:hypothetical protein
VRSATADPCQLLPEVQPRVTVHVRQGGVDWRRRRRRLPHYIAALYSTVSGIDTLPIHHMLHPPILPPIPIPPSSSVIAFPPPRPRHRLHGVSVGVLIRQVKHPTAAATDHPCMQPLAVLVTSASSSPIASLPFWRDERHVRLSDLCGGAWDGRCCDDTRFGGAAPAGLPGRATAA